MGIRGVALLVLCLGFGSAKQGYGPDPDDAPDDFRCGWRRVAYNYSIALRPDSAVKVWDALNLGKYCNGTVPRPSGTPQLYPARREIPGSPHTVFVDGREGDDSNPGTLERPFRTIQRAVDAVEAAGTVVVRGGTYHLHTAVEVGKALDMQNYPGEEVWFSGTTPLVLQGGWEPHASHVWKARLRNPPQRIAELRVDGERRWEARYPNANPETDMYPTGYIQSKDADWLPPKVSPVPNPAEVVRIPTPNRTWDSNFPYYIGGIGGTCSSFDPPFSFFCATSFPWYCAGCETWRVPGGLNITGALSRTYHNPRPYIYAWRANHWSTWKFEVEGYTPQAVTFGKGGFQGARGGNGSDWYISNVFEELDSPGEFFYDNGTLYVYSEEPPSEQVLIEAVTSHTLLRVVGESKDRPVRNVTVVGIGFRDTADTMLEPHGVPGGGDWALERLGVVFVENTELFSLDLCQFWKVGGNSVMLSRYNRNASLTRNEFTWLGGTAIATWGWTDEVTDGGVHGVDGTGGDHPMHTRVDSNLFHEIGIWEKQSSAYFQAKSTQTILTRNVVFNVARAGFNFNDGFGGGDLISQNVLFHTCRESSDHGPINTWDRQPFLTSVRGKRDMQMEWRTVERNLVVSNYGGWKGVDTDDGALFWKIRDNVMVYGLAQKFLAGGIWSYRNLKLYITVGGQFNVGAMVTPGEHYYPNTWFNDTMVKLGRGNLFYHSCWGAKYDATQITNNTIYMEPGYNATVPCNHTSLSLRQFQAKGFEPGSQQINMIPSTHAMVEWAVAKLGDFR